jgi:uncharacterized protein
VCSEKHADVVEILLTNKALVNMADSDGAMALHRACLRGRNRVAAVLPDGGADVNVADNTGDRPLLRASFEGHDALVRLLLSISMQRMCNQAPLCT